MAEDIALVERIIQSHVAEQLCGYGGNLALVAQVVRSEWLPDENHPDIRQHLETLKEHLAKSGPPDDDRFLLRFGLTVPGMQRGIVPPLEVLKENRGGFSVRRQKEAEGQIRRLRAALTIGRRFIPHLSRDTQQALRELAELPQDSKARNDKALLDWFAELSSDEANQLAERAVDYLDGKDSSVEQIGVEILQGLACFRTAPLAESYCHRLIEREIFWPSSLYRDGGDTVAEQLISQIESSRERLQLNHLLLALAWTRSAAAQRAFLAWAAQPPEWTSQLHVPPVEYLPSAGWTIEQGERRDLIGPTCFRLLPAKGAAPGVVRCRARAGGDCPSCGGPRAWLFDFSKLAANHLPGEFAEAPRRILCCLHCACYGPVFTSYRNGEEEWLSAQDPCEFAYDGDRDERFHRLDDGPSPPFVGAEPFRLEDASTLGGIPMWLQDAEYPRCLHCDRLMTFFAQHDNGSHGEEGIYYAFFCAPCHVAAVRYQQT